MKKLLMSFYKCRCLQKKTAGPVPVNFFVPPVSQRLTSRFETELKHQSTE
jgi:hypothetical protein